MLPGVFFLVVGASGVGKDSIIGGAKRQLAGSQWIHFVERSITRPADAGGEAHRFVAPDAFRELQANGAFCLSWRAHGWHYGIDGRVRDIVAGGRSAVANVSRTILDDARRDFSHVRVVNVTAPPERLEQRLRGRGRETEPDIAARLARADRNTPAGPDVIELANNGAIEEAVSRFVAILRAEHSSVR